MGGGGPGRQAPEGWEAGALEGELQKVGGGGPGGRARWCSKIEKRRAGMN